MQSNFYILHQNPNLLQFDHLYRDSQTRQLFSNTSFKLYAMGRCELPLSPALQGGKKKKKRLWLLCLEVCVHLEEGFAEEQNLFHWVAGGRKCLWSVPVLILTCAAVDECSTARRGERTRCDVEQGSISRSEELFLLGFAGGLWFSSGVRSTEMKFMFCVKCWAVLLQRMERQNKSRV